MKLPEPIQFTRDDLKSLIVAYDFETITTKINERIREHHERMFEGAVEMYAGRDHDSFPLTLFQSEWHTHKMIVLRPEPIQKGITQADIVRTLRSFQPGITLGAIHDLADRIEREGIR